MTKYTSLLLAVLIAACGFNEPTEPPPPEPVVLNDTVLVSVEQTTHDDCYSTPWLQPDAVHFEGKWLNYLTNAAPTDRLYGRVDYWDGYMPEGAWENFNSGSVADSVWTIGYCVNVSATLSYSLRVTAFTVGRERGDTTFLPDSTVAQWDHVYTPTPSAERSQSHGAHQQTRPAILLGYR